MAVVAVVLLAVAPVSAAAAPRAPFAAAEASSSQRGAGAALAVDGRTATMWRARRSGAWSWRGRLARTASLDRVRVLAAHRLAGVRISVSPDGRRYRHVRTVAVGRRSWRAVALGGRRARFVRISGRARKGVRGGGLAEVQVRLRVAPVNLPAAGVLVPPAPLGMASPPAAAPPTEPGADPAPEPSCRPRARAADPPVRPPELPAPLAPDPAGAPAPSPSGATPFSGVVTTPIDASQLQALPFHTRSHWLQPWRAYLDTPPARRLRDAIGINFNAERAHVEPAARLLAANGFRRARIEIPWGDFAYEDPTRLIHRDRVAETLCAVRDAGLRPLILLNADDQRPVPSFGIELTLAEGARAGDTEIALTPESAAQVIRLYTGVDGTFAAESLITELRGSVAVLSKPLVLPAGSPDAIPAGGVLPATVLRYLPFSPPRYDDGTLNPHAEETLQGWLQYVGAVTGFVRSMLGTTAFDVELSNELNLHAAFWDANNYFEPDVVASGLPDQVIVDRTVAWIEDPAHDLAGVRVTNGFASQRPWDSGATSPPGLDALSKHAYPRNLRFPDILAPDSDDGLRFNEPVDAEGGRTATRGGEDEPWVDPFVPTYDTFFPEFWLTGIGTETLTRDLAPWEDDTVNPPVRHGRTVAAPDGRVPELWMTEVGLETGWARDALGLDLSDEDVGRIRAKAALRALVAFVHKGMTQVDLYAAVTPEWGLIGGDFWRLLRDTGAYPGDGTGGPVLDGVRRLVAALGDDDVTTARRLTLASIGDYGGRTQLAGDGTPAHPDLHDRDVLAVLPFQAADHRFVVPVYVMTRNLAKVHDPGAAGPARFDLPEERYQLTIGGTDARRARVRAVDPLTGADVPVDVVRRTEDDWLVVELPVTDSPRLLIVDDAATGPELP